MQLPALLSHKKSVPKKAKREASVLKLKTRVLSKPKHFRRKSLLRPRVVITRPLPGFDLDKLEKIAEVVVWPKLRRINRAEFLKFVKGATVIVPMLTERVDREVVEAAGEDLKLVANYAVGFDNLDLRFLDERKIYATNTPGILTEAVAEHTMTLLLAVARRISEAEDFIKGGKFTAFEPQLLLGTQLYGKTIGIVGLGRIGMYVAQMAYSGFHMQVVYHDVARNMQFEEMFEAKYKSLTELYKTSDFISIHVPFMPSTFHLINARAFSLMKRSAILVNTSRGAVVDEVALVKALKDGQIMGAGLDVFEKEPKFAAGLLSQKRVVLTPHIASGTVEARSSMSEMVLTNILAALNGSVPPNVVSFKVEG